MLSKIKKFFFLGGGGGDATCMCIYTILEKEAIIRGGEWITEINYRTQAMIPVLVVQAGDGMGGKQFLCLDVLVHRDLYRLPEARSTNRLWSGWEGSVMMLPACFFTLELYKSWRLGRCTPKILSAVLAVRCRLLEYIYIYIYIYIHTHTHILYIVANIWSGSKKSIRVVIRQNGYCFGFRTTFMKGFDNFKITWRSISSHFWI